MEKIILRNKEFVIRNLCEYDIHKPDKLLSYINNLIDDSEARITLRVKKTAEQENEWLKDMLLMIRNSRMVMLIAESDNQIVGGIEISFCSDYEERITELGISIVKDYRGYGLGSHLLSKIIDMISGLKPMPAIIRLNVFVDNKHAIDLYQKYGFRIVSRIPNRFEFNGQLVDEIIMLRFFI